MSFDEVLTNISKESLYVIDDMISLSEYIAIDLSVYNKALTNIDISSANACEAYIVDYLKKTKSKVAYGGYLEERNLYKGSQNFIGAENRNVHLGIDLWCRAGAKVLAVFDGEVHSFRNNNNSGDYGPTIILRHIVDGITFYSLYGHLSLTSLDDLKIGQRIVKSEPIATLGTSEVNGGYAPHLHFQLIKDMQGNYGDYPGVSSKNKLDFYRENCPDPNFLLKLN